MKRFYLIPMEKYRTTRGIGRHPRYLSDYKGLGWSNVTYGNSMVGLVAVDNPSAEDHDRLTRHGDVFAFPADLDTRPSPAEAKALDSYLDNIIAPADWVTPEMSYREILRVILGMFFYAQRYAGVSGFKDLFGDGVGMDTKVMDLPDKARLDMITAAKSLWLDDDHIAGDSTMREALLSLASEMASEPVTVAGVVV